MNEEMQLKRRFMDSTPAYRQKQFSEGVKRITELKGSFLHLTKEQQMKTLVVMLDVPQINAAPVPIVAPTPTASSAPALVSTIALSAVSGPGAVPAPASSASPTTPSASAIANDDTGGESARDTISTAIADALADDDMWV